MMGGSVLYATPPRLARYLGGERMIHFLELTRHNGFALYRYNVSLIYCYA